MTRVTVEGAALVRATLELPPDGMHRAVERVGPLTPYVVQEIVEEALHAGPGASLDVCVAGADGERWLMRLHDACARLGAHGIDVRLHRAALTSEDLG